MKFYCLVQSNQWKSRKNLGLQGLPWLHEENKMADINWSSDFDSDMFSLQFDNLLETISSENSLDDYDKIGEDERMELLHIISGFSSTTSTTTATTTSKTPPSSSTLAVQAVLTRQAVAPSPTCIPSFIQTSPVPPQMLFTWTSSSASHNYDPSVQHFNQCTLNIQNYFGSQVSNQLASSRMELSMECQIASTQANTVSSPPIRKRRTAYIIESDEDWTLKWLYV